MSTLGTLQRFHEVIDFEYEMDRLTSQFSLVEDYSWYRLQSNGVRWRGGSINKRDLLTRVQFKTTIPIGRSWNFRLRFDKKVSPTTDRNRLTFVFDKSWSSGLFAFAEGSLDALKTDSDVEVGMGLRSSATTNPRHQAKLSLEVVRVRSSGSPEVVRPARTSVAEEAPPTRIGRGPRGHIPTGIVAAIR